LREEKEWDAKKMSKEFPAKEWTSTSFQIKVVILKRIIVHNVVDYNDTSRFLLVYHIMLNIATVKII